MLSRQWAVRALSAAAAVVAVAGLIPTSPASAAATVTRSTTGAYGKAVYIQNGSWWLYAQDTLSDGHCARFQVSTNGTSGWSWTGDSACSGDLEQVDLGGSNYYYRICRTGVGNCSSAMDL